MTEEVMPGVTVGQEPSSVHRLASFSKVRSRVIIDALEQTTAAGGGREQFVERVRDLLRAAGINPDAPHLNLPTTPAGPGGPPAGGTPGGPPATPPLLAGQASGGGNP